MGPYQRTPKKVTRTIRYSGLGVCSAGPVGDFLDMNIVHPDLGPRSQLPGTTQPVESIRAEFVVFGSLVSITQDLRVLLARGMWIFFTKNPCQVCLMKTFQKI